MGFFSNMYSKEGPGVPKDAPKKKGIARYFEMVGRDAFMLWRTGLLTTVCFVPAAVFAMFTVLFRQYLGMVAIGVVGYILSSLLVGPALCAMHAIVVKCVRDEPCYMMHTYKKAWKDNAKQARPIGVLMMVLLATEGYMAMYYVGAPGGTNYVMTALVFFCLLVVFTCSLTVFLQMLFLDMPVRMMLKNSLLMMFGFALRVVPAGMILMFAYSGMLLFVPIPFWLPLFALGLPVWFCLWADMLVWPVMEKAFQITERQTEKKLAEENGVVTVGAQDSASQPEEPQE